MAKNNYFDDDEKRKERVKKRKKGGVLKGLLIFVLFVVIAFGAFIGTIKIVKPNFDLMSLVPAQVMAWFESEPQPTDAETTTKADEPTTEPTTIAPKFPMQDYVEQSEFAFKTSVQGNHIGSLLNGGLVGTDGSYIYHYVDGKGIYRFVPSTEQFGLYYGVKDSISCMNLRGDYIYYVNNKDNTLYKVQKGKSKPTAFCENVKFAYVYDKQIYCVTTDEKIVTMTTDKNDETVLYDSNGDELDFVGISLSGVYFTSTDFQSNVSYLTVDIESQEVAEFRQATTDDAIVKMQLENGFMYYYQKQNDGTYNLCRQKFGSDTVVTLVENATTQDYPEIDSNRLYYSLVKDNAYYVKEKNMNSDKDKVMLYANGVTDENALSFYLGDEYNFIIGKTAENGDVVYKGSSIYTSSTNVMKFNKGSWSY